METKMLRFRISCMKPLFHYLGVNAPSCSELGNFFKELHGAAEKERKPWSKIINLKSSACASIDIFNCICKREGQLLHSVTASFSHVVAGNADWIPLWNFFRAILNHVTDQAHRWFGRVNVGISCNVFFQNVVLSRATQLARWYSLCLSNGDVKRQ